MWHWNVEEMSGRLLIKVSDTGVGIRDEDKERIFERFYQVEQEEPELQSTGSGIGLSLVRDFVTLHEGTVRVVDNVGPAVCSWLSFRLNMCM